MFDIGFKVFALLIGLQLFGDATGIDLIPLLLDRVQETATALRQGDFGGLGNNLDGLLGSSGGDGVLASY